jgi:hypothetical protein
VGEGRSNGCTFGMVYFGSLTRMLLERKKADRRRSFLIRAPGSCVIHGVVSS